MNAETREEVTLLEGVKEENLPKRVWKHNFRNIRNDIKGQQKLPRSVQAKEVQYGEYPKYMLKNSLTD